MHIDAHRGTVDLLADLWQTLTRSSAPTDDARITALESVAVLHFSGDDAAGFLQGYLTCDLDALTVDRLAPTALCNLKGRVVANGWARTDPSGGVDWIVHVSMTQAIEAFLRPYLAFSSTSVAVLENTLILGVLGKTVAGAMPIGDAIALALVDSPEALERFASAGEPVTESTGTTRWLRRTSCSSRSGRARDFYRK